MNMRASKKEMQKRLKDLSRQSYPGHGDGFLRSNDKNTDPISLLSGLVASGGNMPALVSDLHAFLYRDGIDEGSYSKMLFDPALTDIRKLPAALLDAKKVLPPLDYIPKSREELRTFLERLMLLNGSENNYDLLVAGWSGGDAPGRAFDAHVVRLNDLRSSDPDMYNALVSGHFAPVVAGLRQKVVKNRPAFRRLRGLLVAQSLIWCCHDVQLIIARIGQKPQFGPLLFKQSDTVSPEGAMNRLRKHKRAAVEEALDLFFGTRDWRFGEVAAPVKRIELDLVGCKSRLILAHKRQLEGAFGKGDDGPLPLEQVSELMRQIAALLRPDNLLIARTGEAPTANREARDFATEWYGVKSTLTAAAVAILRLMQAEVEIPRIIDSLIGSEFKAMRDNERLGAFSDFPFPKGAGRRLDELMAFYRESLLNTDKREREGEQRPWKATLAARQFILSGGQRSTGDFHRVHDDGARSIQLLDVIPEYRFAATFEPNEGEGGLL